MPYFSVPIEIPKPKVSFDWSDVYFLAESENQDFTDAKIVSAKNEFQSMIHQRALSIVLDKYPNWGYTDNKRAENFLRKTERELLKKCEGHVFEQVSVERDGSLRIVVDVEDVNDDDTITKALDLFAMYKRDKSVQTFGKPITFSPNDFDFDQFDEEEYLC